MTNAECLQDVPGTCCAGKNLKNYVKEFISWVILRGFLKILHNKFMKFSILIVKIPNKFFVLLLFYFYFFIDRGSIGHWEGGAGTPALYHLWKMILVNVIVYLNKIFLHRPKKVLDHV